MKSVLLLTIICIFTYTNLFSQITYNIAKPMSYGNTQLNTLENLPTLDFDVKANGSVFNSNLNINVKTLVESEKLHGKNIARLKFKIKALSLGEMSLYFKDVKLKNGAYCFVYTNDYQIVAGPIYEKSINGNLNIMKLPASELILEVVYNNESDFDLKLDGISFQSLVDLTENKKKKNEHEILSGYDSCYTCDYGQVKYVDRALNCGYFGHGHNNEIFNLQKLKSATDYDYDAIRSACLIMVPVDCEENIYSGTAQGTLMNFPYADCTDPSDDCGKGFVFTVYHEVYTQIVLAHIEENWEYLDNTLIRFNWNYKYGTPWHLENVNCEANSTNEDLWRSTINFDDVIDYCGVEVFAYGWPSDIVIMKMKQKPFYKEHHLGWSTQNYYDVKYEGGSNYFARNSEEFKIVGRRNPKPAMVLENYEIEVPSNFYAIMSVHDTSQGDSPPSTYIGYSGSQLTYPYYENIEQRIGIGISISASHSVGLINIHTHWMYFKYFGDIIFTESCYSQYDTIHTYFDEHFASEILTRNYTYINHQDSVKEGSHTWYPSANIKQKCPSSVGYDRESDRYTDSCDFNINTYVDYIFSNDTLCITIDSIPLHLFPDNYLPMGYRVYHNFGEQKTLAFDSFADSANITYPIEFCMTSCDIMFLMTLGKENINIGIDFYDDEGRILNNPGCDSLDFIIDFPFEFCDIFDVDVKKVDSSECCIYEVKLIFDGCAVDNSLLSIIKNSLSFQSFMDDLAIPINTTDNFTIDYANGEIKFNFSVCKDAPENEPYEFTIFFENNGLYCETEPIEFESCLICDCQFGVEMQEWVELTVEPDMDCGPNKCKISGRINIPSIYDCYERYTLNSNPIKTPIPPDGSITWYETQPMYGCLERGEFRQDTIRLYRTPSDQNPCIIYKQAYCPIESFIVPCMPDCDTVQFLPPKTLEFNLSNLGCPNCRVYATYTHRENTCEFPILQELQILSFRVASNEIDSTACEMCILTEDQIHRETVLQAIYKNDMGFRPLNATPEGNCDETWRVVQAACWTHYSGVWGDFYIPCDSVECCSVGLRVCRYPDPPNPNGYITVDTLTSNIADSLCYDGEEPLQQHVRLFMEGGDAPYIDPATGQWVYEWLGINDTLDCLDRCTALLGLQTGPGGYSYLEKRTFDYEYDIETKEYYGFDEINIKIKFNQDFVDFYINSDIESQNLNIAIHSIYGNKLISNTFGLLKGENYYQVNTSKLVTGMYLISIQLNGSLLRTEKLLIIR